MAKKKKTSIKKLVSNARKACARYNKRQRCSLVDALKLGKIFNKLKPKIQKEKQKTWGIYVIEQFPEIDERTRQRCMRLARYVDLKQYPFLGLLSQNQLASLCQLSNNKVGSYLAKNFTLDFDINEEELIAIFLGKINQHIKEKSKSSDPNDNKEPQAKKTLHTQKFLSWLKQYKKKGARMPESEIKYLEEIQIGLKALIKRYSK